MSGLDLFSGIGGLTIALAPWVQPVAYCENDRHAQAVLFSRMAAGDLPVQPIWDDVRSLVGGMLPGVDIIYGGFPCQDISVAGTGAGLGGERSGLFFEIARLVGELRPAFVFLENVPAITVRGLDRVLMAFTSLGYDCRWTIVSAAEVGAPHLRERWFLLAHRHRDGLQVQPKRHGEESKSEGSFRGDSDRLRDAIPNTQRQRLWDEPWGRGWAQRESAAVTGDNGSSRSLAHPARIGRGKGRPEPITTWSAEFGRDGSEISNATRELPYRAGDEGDRRTEPSDGDRWAVEPNVGRVAHGVPARVDRLRGLGNAVVPLQAREAFKRLMGFA